MARISFNGTGDLGNFILWLEVTQVPLFELPASFISNDTTSATGILLLTNTFSLSLFLTTMATSRPLDFKYFWNLCEVFIKLKSLVVYFPRLWVLHPLTLRISLGFRGANPAASENLLSFPLSWVSGNWAAGMDFPIPPYSWWSTARIHCPSL